jgi:antitoxin component YwqK of YwqJK toxin-antitoxin module
MIKKIILIVLLLVVGCEKETLEYKKDRKHYSSKTNKPYNGLWTTLYENGNKKSEGKYKDGKQDGPWTYWYENEQKKSEGTYKDGKLDGKRTWWNENGQKMSEGVFKDDENHGTWTYWYENGQKKSEGTYKDGEKVGTWTYWYENGQKKSEEVTLTPEQKSEILREEIEELLKQDKYTPVHEIDIDQSKCNLKLAKQFAYNRLSKASYGSGTNLYGQFVKYKDSPFFCRYKFTGDMFDRYNNPHYFSISVNYNGYSWNVVNVDIQPW